MSEDLLTIKQAAKALKVSEASLRRWTESGRLPCLRVGGRRERRFRHADLMSFLEPSAATSSLDVRSEPATAIREVQLEGMHIPRGSHLCELYESDDGRLRLSVPFLAQGVAQRERCFLVAQPEVAAQILARVRDVVAGVDVAIETGRVTLSQGNRRPLEMLTFFRREFLDCNARGDGAIRVLGDMSCFMDRGAVLHELMEFEHRYNQGLGRDFPVVSLCQYDVRRFSGLAVLQACRAHDDGLRFPLRSFLGI